MRPNIGGDVLTRRFWLRLGLLLAVVSCRDAAEPSAVADVVASDPFAGVHILQQAPTAPPLETYTTAFWVTKGKAATLVVNYQSPDGQSVPDPFLVFSVPKDGLIAGADDPHMAKGDSILLTLSIDPNGFLAHFGPSGVKFSAKAPAVLTMCYEYMDPDLNGDGIVDDTDKALQQQLSFWTQSMKAGDWFKLPTKYDPANPCVSAQIFHFSEYAVSW
ncbi:MAG TPA: hypothetical protein VGQ18_05440 [Gemmatimonadales bacterium]|jgi:hypothetical protein|nr:hypothetical protein [Gemmatimonadales bacterium]